MGLRRLAAALLALGLAGCAVPAPPTPAAAPAAPAPRPPPPARAGALVGATPAQVVAIMGPPALRRVDGPAEVWLYGGEAGCRLDLIFYRDAAALRVALATAHAPPKLTESACLARLAAAP
ncbi:MAG: hypothetical protein BGP12_18450 [Rhodospirillales bacterium 70-18]|nr:MAG: hypothetical protein BGP12_18450 [Rhodospirillales bacterium 70-18]